MKMGISYKESKTSSESKKRGELTHDRRVYNKNLENSLIGR